MLTGDPVWDGIGTVGIGVLLGVIAVILMVEMHSLLIGEGATRQEDAAIRAALEQTEHIDRLIHIRTQYLGPEEMLVGAKIALAPSTRPGHGGRHHRRGRGGVRAAVPAAQVIYLEPDLDRALAESRAERVARFVALRPTTRMLCRMVRPTSRGDGTM